MTYHPRSSIAVFLCVAYLVLIGVLPLIGIHHALTSDGENATHHAIDACTWIQDTIGPSVCSVADTELSVIVTPFSHLLLLRQLIDSGWPESIQARAPPRLFT